MPVCLDFRDQIKTDMDAWVQAVCMPARPAGEVDGVRARAGRVRDDGTYVLVYLLRRTRYVTAVESVKGLTYVAIPFVISANAR
jgi:hypothetical protein